MESTFKFDQKNVRQHHYFLLLSLIQKNKRVSRTQLSNYTGISKTTVGKIIKDLISDQLVIETGQTNGDLGRKASLLEINPEGAFIIGVDIDTHLIKIALVTLNGKIIRNETFSQEVRNKPIQTLRKLVDIITFFINKNDDIDQQKILAIGISIPGLISWPEGVAKQIPQFNWSNIEIRKFLMGFFSFEIFVDNDVRSVLLAEYLFGGLSHYQNSICIFVGSGFGSAVMSEGKILRGYNNTLGEIGHTTIDPNGALCDCGRLGCLQTFICISEIEKQTQKRFDEIIFALNNSEDWAIRVIERGLYYLGITISNEVCMYNPEAVLLAGPFFTKLASSFSNIFERLEAEIDHHIWLPLKNTFTLVSPSLGENSGVIGASAIVLNNFLKSYSNLHIP
jgi:predicted NBD/HSP70 family sugar kinase/biotin operon repressor